MIYFMGLLLIVAAFIFGQLYGQKLEQEAAAKALAEFERGEITAIATLKKIRDRMVHYL